MNPYTWRTLAAAVLSGLGGYLRVSGSTDPRVRRLRFVYLISPFLPPLLLRISSRDEPGPNGEPGMSFSCLPTYVLMLGAIAYGLYSLYTGWKSRST